MKKIIMKTIAVLSVAMMVVCMIPSTLASQDNGQKQKMHEAMHDEKMNIGDPARFSHDNETFETQQEKLLEQINDTISKIDSGEIDDENITAEMLENVTTQLEDVKTIVENAEDVDDLKEAKELVNSAMETLGMGPAMMGKPEALQDKEIFETTQERLLEQVNNTISKIEYDIENIDELDNENITEEMLTTALPELEEVKTLITNAEGEDDLKEAMEQMHSAMEELGIGPTNERRMEHRPMEKAGIIPEKESSTA